jgi:dTDP-4-dehydrorhamnose 3,5-epimerase
MDFEPAPLPGVVLVKPRVFADDRGFFLETWQARSFSAAGIDLPFVQDNHSHSAQWVLRGMHYQVRHPQGKFVRVLTGEVFDVAVDMRQGSSHFGRWFGARLSAENRLGMWIPPGFAHGFLALSPRVDFVYKCTDYYHPAEERSVRWDDPSIAIEWPLPAGVAPRVSARDAAAPLLAAAERFP